MLDQVLEFHEKFGIPHRSVPTAKLPKSEWTLRHEIMREENEEYLLACDKGDLKAVADALGDQLYVLCGSILAHGLQDKIAAIFAEIHRSNMSKLDENGNAIFREDGKILKSDRYFRPDILAILEGSDS